jgi:putative phosphoesterase
VEWLRRADLILHAGDFVGASVLDELRALAPVEAVRGNMDEPALQAALPERLVVTVEDVRIGLVHIPGSRAGREERLAGWFPGCAAVVYGHTHVPQLERQRDVWIVNPGSPTERRRARGHSMALLEVAGRTLQSRLIGLS